MRKWKRPVRSGKPKDCSTTTLPPAHASASSPGMVLMQDRRLAAFPPRRCRASNCGHEPAVKYFVRLVPLLRYESRDAEHGVLLKNAHISNAVLGQLGLERFLESRDIHA